jgi:acylphosphatase
VSGEAAAERHEVYYSGRVQGVGFRYTVRWVAKRFAVTGFVKNLPDGRVQLVAEGRPDELRRFLDAVDAEMGHYVVDRQGQAGAASGRFQGFEIRF